MSLIELAPIAFVVAGAAAGFRLGAGHGTAGMVAGAAAGGVAGLLIYLLTVVSSATVLERLHPTDGRRSRHRP